MALDTDQGIPSLPPHLSVRLTPQEPSRKEKTGLDRWRDTDGILRKRLNLPIRSRSGGMSHAPELTAVGEHNLSSGGSSNNSSARKVPECREHHESRLQLKTGESHGLVSFSLPLEHRMHVARNDLALDVFGGRMTKG